MLLKAKLPIWVFITITAIGIAVIILLNQYKSSVLDEIRLQSIENAYWTKIIPKVSQLAGWKTYRNEQYGFTLTLSQGWQGYSATTSPIEYGWKIVIQHPQWTEVNPYEDIPILVYPIEQWKKWEANNFEDYPTAAPFGPLERGRNAQYVFATAPRYNYDYRTGWEDVENIIKTLKAF